MGVTREGRRNLVFRSLKVRCDDWASELAIRDERTYLKKRNDWDTSHVGTSIFVYVCLCTGVSVRKDGIPT